MKDFELIEKAKNAMNNSYSPYSGFAVGAALLAVNENGEEEVFTATNIENAAYSASICAERSAFCEAINHGYRKFTHIAVCGGKDGVITELCPPCGECRQFMSEFCDREFRIILTDGKEVKSWPLGSLFTLAFKIEK